LGESYIEKKIPFVRELSNNYGGVDPVHEPIPVRPVVHYMMGGIDTDIEAATTLPGLYAAGECACVSINGANRLGSNSLTELLVFGAQAGRNAAIFAQQHGISGENDLLSQTQDEINRISELLGNRAGDEKIADLRNIMTSALEEGAGIYRNAEGMQKACTTITELRKRSKNLKLDDTSLSYNTELTSAIELDFMLDIAETVTFSALRRKESRGSHQRTDFPERDDDEFLKHSLAYNTDDAPRIEHKDVVITNLPPAKRIYGGGK
tara:strand:- start:2097 stop:2891 length:795 start_codon:yes stop_codon:yes gene_type:complete